MLVVIRGAGDLATGIALRLHRAGYQIVMTDLPAPTSIRRTVCFSEAIRLGEMTVEDISAYVGLSRSQLFRPESRNPGGSPDSGSVRRCGRSR